MSGNWIAAGLAVVTVGLPLGVQPVFAQADTCMEDEPCWNCETMGNKICGPQVVEGCHFDGMDWVYQDNTLCRGTGEDPTTDSYGRPSCADHRTAIQQPNGRVNCVTVYQVKHGSGVRNVVEDASGFVI